MASRAPARTSRATTGSGRRGARSPPPAEGRRRRGGGPRWRRRAGRSSLWWLGVGFAPVVGEETVTIDRVALCAEPAERRGADPGGRGAARRHGDPGPRELLPEAYRPVADGLHGGRQGAEALGEGGGRQRDRAEHGAARLPRGGIDLAAAGVEDGRGDRDPARGGGSRGGRAG